MREIVFDTETTGLDAGKDRIIEVGCVELMNWVETGRTYRTMIDPGVSLSAEITKITGYTTSDVKGQPRFEQIVDELMAFIGDADVVAHNAEFDRGFLNAELVRLKRAPAPNRFVDTRKLAAEKLPGAGGSLNALCRTYSDRICERFKVAKWEDARPKHGALIDAQLLAVCYLELRGGRQTTLELSAANARGGAGAMVARAQRPDPLPSRIRPEEAEAHAAFIAEMGDGALWRNFG